ncbi:MAG: arylesterase [Thiobacillaceae bacterium]
MNYRVLLGLVLCLPTWAVAAQCSLLIVGDSLSSGYGLAAGESWVNKLAARLEKSAPDWRVVNASVSGDTLQNGLQRLSPALWRHKPSGVLIELGGNDALRGTPPATIRLNLGNLVKQARASGAWVALLEPPILPNYGKAYGTAIKQVYVDVAREQKVTRVPCFICGVATDPALMQKDGIHPNARAQTKMMEAVWPSIQPKLHCMNSKRS